jgi:hypothetical protein
VVVVAAEESLDVIVGSLRQRGGSERDRREERTKFFFGKGS